MHCAAHQTNLSAGHGKGNRDVTVLERWVIRVVARRSRVRPCWLLLAGQQGCGLEKKQPKKQRAWGRRSVHRSSLHCGESPATATRSLTTRQPAQLGGHLPAGAARRYPAVITAAGTTSSAARSPQPATTLTCSVWGS